MMTIVPENKRTAKLTFVDTPPAPENVKCSEIIKGQAQKKEEKSKRNIVALSRVNFSTAGAYEYV